MRTSLRFYVQCLILIISSTHIMKKFNEIMFSPFSNSYFLSILILCEIAAESLWFHNVFGYNHNIIVSSCFRECIIYNSTCTDHKLMGNFSRISFSTFYSGSLCLFPYIVDTASCTENYLHCYNQIGNFMDKKPDWYPRNNASHSR